ncbi:D-alanine--D-alanine ligase family protein [Fulvivirga sedimenti]|uniref:D-alanine--D-alanine ligase n=1 Tax=Fulvivirga sedimenti TaxID=2879465 RepID=A0A9X1HQS0_9BACT|nr:D-alanine--D-alanine ligase family protein [Fulvivirga sedimenti]MCA6074884.1 D-alanine--D-alanine ligase [Fulvivirga sedimenti]MCA6076061.1 D-alanine--D-alanine ligase [Fulvivirga sedimenti]MCA6077189.1 D-alanine--D-alanine ligase [Fulvivirga sedimenti]
MSKLHVAVLFGGKSVEHEISINSARNIFEFIDRSRFEVSLIGISRTGGWYLKKEVNADISSGEPLRLNMSGSRKGFMRLNNEILPIDVVFPVLHGTDGEDGSIQGLLTSFEITFVGTGVLGSAMSMSKLYTKRLLEASGIPVSKFLTYSFEDRSSIRFDHIEKNLGLPFMIKAANLGSSVGVFKVKEKKGFEAIVDEVFKFDHTLLFEEFVEGRELECAVMGNRDVKASLPGEVVVSSDYEFYTYEAKYLDPEAAKIVVPADIPEDIAEKIRQHSIKTYKTLHCEDFARVDLFLKKDGTILINEINTIPGFTNSSMFPMMWKERGISFQDLISQLIELAMERHEQRKRIVKSR